MGSCYSIDNIAEDHIHTDITCNIEEPQQKYHLGTVSSRLLGGGGGGGGGLNMFSRILTLALSFCSGSKHLVHMKFINLSMNQHRKQTNQE